MQDKERVIRNCIALLEQAATLLTRIDKNLYARKLKVSPRGSIGGHLRHCLDFYQSFLFGLDRGRIDYNDRQRDTLAERDPRHALPRIEMTIAALRSISRNDQPLSLMVSTETDGNNPPSWCSSSVMRELEFLQSHTVHHYSVIAMLLRLQGVEPVEEFGVAPSTLEHWRERAACAR